MYADWKQDLISQVLTGKKRISTKAALSYKRKKTSYQSVPKVTPDGKLSEKSIGIKLGEPKTLYEPLGDWTFINQCAGVSGNNLGQQGFSELLNMASRRHFNEGDTTITASNSAFYFDKNLFKLDPNSKTTGGPVFAAQESVSQQLHLKTISGHMQFMNASTLPTWNHLYIVRYKQNTDDSVHDVWENALVTGALGQSSSGNPTTPTDAISVGRTHTYTYGSSPFAYPTFNKVFESVYSDKFALTGGDTLRLNYNIAMHKTYHEENIVELDTLHMKGELVWFLITRPSVVLAEKKGTNPFSYPTTGAAQIVWTSTQIYKMSSMGPVTTKMSRAAPGFISFTLAGDYEQKHINSAEETEVKVEIGTTV